MKKIIICLLVVLLGSMACMAQTPRLPEVQEPSRSNTSRYLHMSRVYKGLAWGSLGLGAAMDAEGVVWTFLAIGNDGSPKDNDRHGITAMFVCGTTLMVASVPLFGMAHKYKMKALGDNTVLTVRPTAMTNGFGNNICPGLSLALEF